MNSFTDGLMTSGVAHGKVILLGIIHSPIQVGSVYSHHIREPMHVPMLAKCSVLCSSGVSR